MVTITQRDEHGVSVYVLDGRIDSEGAVQLESTLQQGYDDGQYKMVLDMERVHYINSAALRSIADIITKNRAQSGDLRLAALPPKVKRVLQIVGIAKYTAIYDTVDEACQNF